MPLSEGWLAESIEHAAEGAGYHRWHLAPEVAPGHRGLPRERLDRAFAAGGSFARHVRRSLEGIGYEDIAQKSLIVPPRVSISLTELAMRAPYEIEFYPLLKERLADALEVQVGGVRLEGLRDCTKVLDAAGRWRSTCTRISDDIIYFCRSYIYRTRPRTVDLVIQ